MRMSLSSRAYGSALALCFVALSVTLAPGTPALASSSTCPNEALRAESNVNPVTGTPFSAELPECRAYELVSTAAKNDSNVTEPMPDQDEPALWVTPDGDSVLWSTGDYTAYGEASANGFSDVFGATRGPTGWLQSATLAVPGSAPTLTRPIAVSGDLSTAVLLRVEGLTPTRSSTELVERRPDGSYEEIASGLPDVLNSVSAEVSEDGSHTFFQTSAQLAGDTHVAGHQLYEWTPAGGLHVFAVDSEGRPTSPCGAAFASVSVGSDQGAIDGESRDVSSDGSRVFFLSPDPTQHSEKREECDLGPNKTYVSDLYVREDDSTTIDISKPLAGEPDYGASYVGATANVSRVFFITPNQLTPEKSTTLPDLYEYNVETKTLTRLSIGPPGYDEANVGSAVVSEDGSHVYFEATGQLVPRAGAAYPEGSSTTNLYLYTAGSVHFIATVSNVGADGFSPVEFEPTDVGGLRRYAWVTPSGGDLLFYSAARLAGYDNEDHFELYRYDAASSTVSCVSCNPLGAAPGGAAPLIRGYTPYDSEKFIREEQEHAVSADGSTVFFDSAEKLLPAAANARDGEHERVYDVYEWHDGVLSLISTGTSAYSDWLYNASASGSDVFFETRERLVAQDGEEAYDLYDARVEGGFSAPPAPAQCVSLATCRGMVATPPVPIAPASVSVSGSGNLAPVAEAPPATAPTKPKPLTRAQQLAKALKACKAKKNKKKRATCEAQAQKMYGASHKAKKSAKRGGRS
jgi:hypothetical protein